jgi:hypothetical protein
MHKNATKCNETIGKWCKNKHGASKIIDMFETYQGVQDFQLEPIHNSKRYMLVYTRNWILSLLFVAPHM